MVIGIGSDIVEVKRIAKLRERHPQRFAARILTPTELKAYQICVRPHRFLAKRFAVKEAVSKALGTGFRQGVSWQDIEIENNALGKPSVRLNGRAQAVADGLQATSVLVSLSDEREYVVAFAVLS